MKIKETGICLAIFASLLIQICNGKTYYEHYAPNGERNSGLVAEGDSFTLNGKEIQIFSGAFHYFRVHPDYWRDTFKRLRSAGLNTVETYVPWNLHEPRKGVYDFGDLGEDMSPFLDVKRFIQMAQEEDLFVLFRPGPYICSEWEFGGLPSWLLRDHTMHVRTYYSGFIEVAARYLDHLLSLINDQEFIEGGPIIAMQIENEYGNFGWSDEPRDKVYLNMIRATFLKNFFSSTLFYTSDSPASKLDWGALPGVLQTANFKNEVDENLSTLKMLQPDRPLMVMEFWTGWFDHWLADVHTTWDAQEFAATLDSILQYNSSFNMYMFIGGTSFGFMAGANTLDVLPHYAPDVTSYDYDAPLTESGDYTQKYTLAKYLISKYNKLTGIVSTPEGPPNRLKRAFGNFSVTSQIPFHDILSQVEGLETTEGVVNMEKLSINDDNGQSYGYIVYKASPSLVEGESTLLVRGHIRDHAQVVVDNTLVTPKYGNILNINDFGFWNGRDNSLKFASTAGPAELYIMVENLGRANFGTPEKFVQKKGLWEGPVHVNGDIINDWTMYPLEFKSAFVNSLANWQDFDSSLAVPSMYKAIVEIQEPEDTYLDMRSWGKGVVFLNGFNLGRYWHVGPQRTLYIPAPLFNEGMNEIVIFEQYDPASEISFIDYPIYV